MKRGWFITVEGIDGAGKSTHLRWLAEFLTTRGEAVLLTREPGGTALGESLRHLLLDPQYAMTAETETLLMFAARREHLASVILPGLAEGKTLLCDRFTDATFAYQGAGRGVSFDKLATMEAWVHEDLQPDITLLFDLPIEIAQARVERSRPADRFELERTEFFQRVRQGYLQRAKQNPERFHVIDSSRPIAEVNQAVEQAMAGRKRA
jgi:dTMP kinase